MGRARHPPALRRQPAPSSPASCVNAFTHPTGGHTVNAGIHQRLERSELGGEPVTSMDARHVGNLRATQGGAEGGVLSDQGDGTGPGRQRIDALGERHTDHCANRIARPTRPAGRFKLDNLRAVEQRRDLYRV
jgi:hypothetical protein